MWARPFARRLLPSIAVWRDVSLSRFRCDSARSAATTCFRRHQDDRAPRWRTASSIRRPEGLTIGDRPSPSSCLCSVGAARMSAPAPVYDRARGPDPPRYRGSSRCPMRWRLCGLASSAHVSATNARRGPAEDSSELRARGFLRLAFTHIERLLLPRWALLQRRFGGVLRGWVGGWVWGRGGGTSVGGGGYCGLVFGERCR